MRLAVILSILARACASQKRKAKPLEIKPKWPKKSKNVVLGYKKWSKVKVENEKIFLGPTLIMKIFVRFCLKPLVFNTFKKTNFSLRIP